jgi:hypothetical protein
MIYVGQIQNPKYFDKTWAVFNGYVTGVVENNVGVMCACAPSLRRFLGVWFRGQRSTSYSPTAKTPSSGDSGAKRSVRLEQDVDRYPEISGAGAVDLEVEYENKSQYVVERVAEPEMALGPGRISARRNEKTPTGKSFYLDSSVAEPEPGEHRNHI